MDGCFAMGSVVAMGIEMLRSPSLCRHALFGVVTITGEGVDDYLQGQLTQDVTRLIPDKLLYAALLTPQGRAVAELWLAADGARRLLIVPSGVLEAVCTRLRRFSLGYALDIAVDDELRLWSLQGVGSGRLVQGVDHCWPMAEASGEGFWLLAAEQPDLHATLVDEAVIEAARIVYGTPRFAVDWCDLPLNANLHERGAISFDKGCYVGQEVTSRMRWRGGVRKCVLHFSLHQLPSALPIDICTSVPVGRLTSAASDGRGAVYGIGQVAIEPVLNGAEFTLADGGSLTALGCPRVDA
ncbi:MAG: hypothetical protein Q9M13_03095 [Mariprofundales bacterium]|nr:hypothetical protein [Mariprofundales bacterium]